MGRGSVGSSSSRAAGAANALDGLKSVAASIERLGDGASERGSQRGSVSSKASMKRTSMKSIMRAGEPEQQLGGPRDTLTVNGQERPILLETRELEQPRLDRLITDIKDYRINQLSVDLNRQRKMRSVDNSITDLKYKRLSYNLSVWPGVSADSKPGSENQQAGREMQPRTWQEINRAKVRQNKTDRLHSVFPQERIRALRSMEASVLAEATMGSSSGSQMSARRSSAPDPRRGSKVSQGSGGAGADASPTSAGRLSPKAESRAATESVKAPTER